MRNLNKLVIPTSCVLLVLLIAVTCSTPKKVQKSVDLSQPHALPNTVLVDSNFYVDETEVANIDWKEFCWWTKKYYGDSSTIYRDLLPDTSVWLKLGEHCSDFTSTYYRNWRFDNYPVVGVSHEQGKAFAQWRTERVAELSLIEAGILQFHPDLDHTQKFTIERYLKGEYLDYEPDPRYSIVGVYDLPTVEDLERITKFDRLSICPSTGSIGLNTEVFDKSRCHSFGFRSIYSYEAGCKSVTGKGSICALFDNVEELTDDPSVVYGQGWPILEVDIRPADGLVLREPGSFVGLRNVCSFVTVEEYLALLEK